jgi:hypothetical protein
MLKSLIKKTFNTLGFEIHKRNYLAQVGKTGKENEGEINEVMPIIASNKGLQQLIATRITLPSTLLGSSEDINHYGSFLNASKTEWEWDVDVSLPENVLIVICSVPLNDKHWRAIRAMKNKYGARVITILEIVLPFTPILFAYDKINYFTKFDELISHYLGKEWFGPIDKLNNLLPLFGKRVIEFGPFDGSQTAGLAIHGVAELVCIEARAENYLKTLIAKEVFGWKNVRLVMDDMHNADAIKYGRFDLAFCHGTYYHSISPFVLLENLISLSDNIFVGGFVIKDNAPSETLIYEGGNYRAQPYKEDLQQFTAGINKTSYFFNPDDLVNFFVSRNFKVVSIEYEDTGEFVTGRFCRFIAYRVSV